MAKAEITVEIERALVEDMKSISSEFIGLCADIACSECWPTCEYLRPCPRCQLVEKMRKRKQRFREIIHK